MITDLLAAGWSDGSGLGYPLLFGLVLLGSIVPVVPTGAVVGAAAAVATTTDHLSLTLVVLVSAVAALTGDLITFAVCRFGGPSAVRWVARGQHTDRIEEVRGQFRRHGWQIIVVGRLLPAGRIPVLLAAGALAYPWRRLLPAVDRRVPALGGRLRGARRAQRRHLRLPAAGHPAGDAADPAGRRRAQPGQQPRAGDRRDRPSPEHCETLVTGRARRAAGSCGPAAPSPAC